MYTSIVSMGSIRIVREGDVVYVQDSDFYLADQIKELREELARLRKLVEKLVADCAK